MLALSVGGWRPLLTAQEQETRVLNPKTYRSASGRFQFTVDPSERYGAGPANYRLLDTAANKEVWAGKLPFTLAEAVIDDDGAVAGCGYSLGADSGGGKGDDFLVVFLNPQGRPRRIEKHPRKRSMVVHGGVGPAADGVSLDAKRDLFLVEFSAGIWWAYRFSDGKALGEIDAWKLLPKETSSDEVGYFDGEARPVAGTSLMLLQTTRAIENTALLVLVDPLPPGRVVWNLKMPLPRKPPPRDPDVYAQPTPETIFPAEGAGRFALWQATTGKRVDYAVEWSAADTRWEIRETGRQPASAPLAAEDMPKVPMPVLPPGKLTTLGTFTLGEADGGPPPAIRSVKTFDFDGQGRIGLVRGESGRSAFLLVKPDNGEVLREVDLSAQDKLGGALYLAWMGPKDRWALLLSRRRDQSATLGWYLDADTGTLTPMEKLDCPEVGNLAGTGDGRFVITQSMADRMIAFDVQARRIWTVDNQFIEGVRPDEITVLDREVGKKVLAGLDEGSTGRVGLFDLETGKLRNRFDLDKIWDHKPNYVCGICPDENGGFVVEDFRGDSPYVRMTAEGKMLAALNPQGVEGQRFTGRDLRCDPVTGRLWATDYNALMRLSLDGKRVDRTLGTPTGIRRVGSVASWVIDDAGRSYVADSCTATVHFFDAEGRFQRALKTDLSDTKLQDGSDLDLADAPDGHVLVGKTWCEVKEGKIQRTDYALDGSRLVTRKLPLTDRYQHWICRTDGGGNELLSLGWHEARLLSLRASAKNTPRVIAKQPNGDWFQSVSGAAFAPDGSFAVVAVGPIFTDESWTVNIYEPDGTGQRTFTLPKEFGSHDFAFNGRQYATRLNGKVAVFDATTGAGVLTFTPELPNGLSLERGEWQMFSVHGGRELWLAESITRTVARFAWPP